MLRAKFFVIDDLNITKGITSRENKDLLKSIKDSVTSNNEEVIVFNTNNDLRLSGTKSSKNPPSVVDCISKGVEIDTPIIEQAQLSKQIEKYEKSVHDLKKLVGTTENIATAKKNEYNVKGVQFINNSNYNGFLKDQTRLLQETDGLSAEDIYNNENKNFYLRKEESKNYSPQLEMNKINIYDTLKSNDVNTKVNDFSHFRGTLSNTNISPDNGILNVPKIDMLSSLEGERSNSQLTEILNSFKKEYSNHLQESVKNVKQNNNSNEFSRLNNNLMLNNVDSMLSNSSQIEKQIEDRLAYTKLKEQNNLYKAIDNRKEYIKMKLQDIKANKDKLSLEMNSYKNKVANILNQIKNIKKAKDTLINQINTNKNHIQNLNKNSIQIIDRKEQVVSLIRITKNEVQRYRNLLENETNKLEMLEKQYEVYEVTLKKYSDDIDTESHKLNRTSTELNKNGIDLENLEELYSEYSRKNQQIEEELRRYEKIAACLDSEEKKVMMNQLNRFVI